MPENQAKFDPDSGSPFYAEVYRSRYMLVAIFLVVLAAYGGTLVIPPLLDEQFLLAWLAHLSHTEAGQSANFLSWSGFSQLDFWGPFTRLSAIACGFLAGSKIFLWRLLQLTLHLVMCWLGFFTLRKLGLGALVATAAVVLFAVYPLHLEAVTWVGGLGTQLAHLSALAAFFLYLHIREKELSWPLVALLLALFAWALSASVYTWVYIPAIIMFELVSCCYVESRPPVQLSDRVIPLLTLVVLGGAYLAGSDFFPVINSSPYLPDLKGKVVSATLKNLIFPVNQLTWHRYAVQYKLFYFLFAPWVVLFLLSVARNRAAARLVLVALSFILFLSLPYFGNACLTPELLGGRFFYGAVFWWAVILAVGASFIVHLQLKPRFLPAAFFLLWIALAAILLSSHTWNQAMAHRNAARHLRAVQKSLKEVGRASGLRYIFLGNVNQPLSVAQGFRWRNLAVFDSQTGLLASSLLSDGRLKDALSVKDVLPPRPDGTAESYAGIVSLWNNDLQTAVVWPFLPAFSPIKSSLPAETLGRLMMPPLIHTPNAYLSADQSDLVIKSAGTSGPVLTVDSCEFSPLDGDFIVLEAAVTLPAGLMRPEMETYWQTVENTTYDADSRKISVSLSQADGNYRRYEIPLRYAGWYAAGIPKFLTFGFPAGSAVSIRSLELVRGTYLLPEFQAPVYAGRTAGQFRYTPPFANFPNLPELGFIPLSVFDREIVCTYSVKHIAGAEAVLLEVSLPDQAFANPNGASLSSVCWKTRKFLPAEGEIRIRREDLPAPGVYSLRIIALDQNNNYISHFSDTLCFQIPK